MNVITYARYAFYLACIAYLLRYLHILEFFNNKNSKDSDFNQNSVDDKNHKEKDNDKTKKLEKKHQENPDKQKDKSILDSIVQMIIPSVPAVYKLANDANGSKNNYGGNSGLKTAADVTNARANGRVDARFNLVLSSPQTPQIDAPGANVIIPRVNPAEVPIYPNSINVLANASKSPASMTTPSNPVANSILDKLHAVHAVHAVPTAANSVINGINDKPAGGSGDIQISTPEIISSNDAGVSPALDPVGSLKAQNSIQAPHLEESKPAPGILAQVEESVKGMFGFLTGVTKLFDGGQTYKDRAASVQSKTQNAVNEQNAYNKWERVSQNNRLVKRNIKYVSSKPVEQVDMLQADTEFHPAGFDSESITPFTRSAGIQDPILLSKNNLKQHFRFYQNNGPISSDINGAATGIPMQGLYQPFACPKEILIDFKRYAVRPQSRQLLLPSNAFYKDFASY